MTAPVASRGCSSPQQWHGFARLRGAALLTFLTPFLDVAFDLAFFDRVAMLAPLRYHAATLLIHSAAPYQINVAARTGRTAISCVHRPCRPALRMASLAPQRSMLG